VTFVIRQPDWLNPRGTPLRAHTAHVIAIAQLAIGPGGCRQRNRYGPLFGRR